MQQLKLYGKNVCKIDMEQQKKIALEVLTYVADFCDRNNITYFLAYGTLLGAVRHKGYIPWDDDIDIMMPRPDYMKFIELFKKDNSKYGIFTPYDDNPMYYFTKVYDKNTLKVEKDIDYTKRFPLGIDIDVFPIDGQVNNKLINIFRCSKRIILRYLLLFSNCKFNSFSIKNFCKAILGFIGKIFGNNNIIKMYFKNYDENRYQKSGIVGINESDGKFFTTFYRKNLFKEKALVNFENKTFWAPKDYDSWLKGQYGDYMQLPPESERITHHGNDVYVILSDTDYLFK